ncbi:unnamed protein product [Rotaria sp. Silwood1]|nr:unnamed protein product [Rotaria sp. Silwood1]CAF1438716.1 unnamed protein product [Rotaria sp. Silwood1]CAF3635034.1 unnamed protein product [Rotaria sp. Silwood1]CAF4501059.1 unnamed protein product [Rotaria sp. Silwood1]CAF4705753.1 unnamed protein product [Rotaria sp. Silwood1]
MMTHLIQSASVAKIFRFIDNDYNPRLFPPVNDYLTYELLTLEQCLKPIAARIDRLNEIIQIAQDKCHHPCQHGLTHDESAAIFLYTMEWDDNTLYQVINRDLRSEEQSISKSWLPYLKLFYTALNKLPNVQMNVWRSIQEDMIKELDNDNEFIWWNITSCSSSIDVIKDFIEINSRLLVIETTAGKDISNYSNFPDQHEIIICSGTRLRFVKYVQDAASSVDIPYLQELTDESERKTSLRVRMNDLINISSSKWYQKWSLFLLIHFIVLILALFLFTPSAKPLTTFILSNGPTSFSSAMQHMFSLIDSLSQAMITDNPSVIHIHVDEIGNRYEGEWKDGKKHGKGKMDYANGYKYIGDWVGDVATGEGIFMWTNDDQYEGQYQNGQRHGKGSYTYANGDKYTGGWFEDKKSGQGIFIWGSTSAWVNNKYEGEFHNDQMHGYGTYSFANGDTYIGGWVNNQQEGHGIFNFSNGDRFEGGFKAGKMHGEGSYYFQNGNKFKGEWNDGEKVADHGAITWASKNRPTMTYSKIYGTQSNDIVSYMRTRLT